MKPCPFCAEEIQDAAVVCRFCGREVARAKAIDDAIADLERASDPEGNMSVADGVRLLNEWNDRVRFGGKSADQLADAVDITDDWRKHLRVKFADRLGIPRYPWAALIMAGVAWVVVVMSGRSNSTLLIAAGLLAYGVAKSAMRYADFEGYMRGAEDGFACATFHWHGVTADKEKEFWDFLQSSEQDANLLEVLGKRPSKARG